MRSESKSALSCSFCHKSQDVVGKLISSPSDYPRAYICDECIAVCNSILEDDDTSRSRKHPLTPQLLDAMRQWVALPAASGESQLAEVRKLVEQILIPTNLESALAMPAGAQLDALVDRQIFGSAPTAGGSVPAYSTSIAEAWKIVERLAPSTAGPSVGIARFRLRYASAFWSAHFQLDDSTPPGVVQLPDFEMSSVQGDTAPLAICRAALKAYS